MIVSQPASVIGGVVLAGVTASERRAGFDDTSMMDENRRRLRESTRTWDDERQDSVYVSNIYGTEGGREAAGR